MVFKKVCLAEFYLSSNSKKFIHVKLKTFANFWPQKSWYGIRVKTGKSEFNFFWEFSMCAMYVKTFAVAPDHIHSFCNCWTLLTFSQKSVSEILMYQLANDLKYLIGCWISHGFTLKMFLHDLLFLSFLYPFQQIFFKKYKYWQVLQIKIPINIKKYW